MPILKQWRGSNDSLWGIWKVDESADELKDMLTATSFDFNILDSYKSQSRKLEYLAVRVLLKYLLGCEKEILHYPTGKPYLADNSYYITISHTKGYVAIGLSKDSEVGIDLEYFSDRVLKVSRRFVRQDEVVDNSTIPCRNKIYKLLLIWSGKETLFKMINSSEVDFLEHLKIFPFDLNIDIDDSEKSFKISEGIMEAIEYRTPYKKKYILNYIVCKDFVCTFSTSTLI